MHGARSTFGPGHAAHGASNTPLAVPGLSMEAEPRSSPVVVGATGADGVQEEDKGCPYSAAELSGMLRNYRLRRRLGLLPRSEAREDADEVPASRWVRQTWRPLSLTPADGRAAAPGQDAQRAPASAPAPELMAQISEVQQRVERGYRELNAERRAHAADVEGLRRQAESAAALGLECDHLRRQLAEAQGEVRARTAANGQLRRELGVQRQYLGSVGGGARGTSNLGSALTPPKQNKNTTSLRPPPPTQLTPPPRLFQAI